MNARRLPIGFLLIIPVIAGLAVYAFTGQQPVEPAPGIETPTETATPTAAATFDATPWVPTVDASILYPTPTPQILERGNFHAGALVRVATGDNDCLNARQSPSTTNDYAVVNICLPNGFEAMITFQPYEADGHWWWYLAGAGYVAEDYIEYVAEADLQSRTVPQFSSLAGHIAFIREPGEIWVMRPDGSDRHRVLEAIDGGNGYNVSPADLQWSPDGSRLSFNIPHWPIDGTTATNDLHILDIASGEEKIVVGVAGSSWSPDGTRIGIVQNAQPGEMGGGWQGRPGYADTITGAITLIDADALPWDKVWLQDPPQFNHDGSLMLMAYYYYDDATSTTQQGILISDLVGASFYQFSPPTDTYYSGAAWSPTANRFAFYANDTTGAWYQIEEINGSNQTTKVPLPPRSEFRGGSCGGGAGMYRPAFSRDGSRLLYPSMFGDTGVNGIWSYDLATGAQTLSPSASPSQPTAGPQSLFAFSDSAIFIGDSAGGFPTLITDGRSPVWSSGQ